MKTLTRSHRTLPAFATLMAFCCLDAAISPRLAAVEPLGAQASIRGNLLLEAKGEVEVYQNGRKIVLRDKSEGQHYLVKIPGREFKSGDTFVLRVLSPYVYRTISIAINLDGGKGGQVPVKAANWRFLGEDAVAAKITAADIMACQEPVALGAPDATGEVQRAKLGMIPADQGGPDWVKSAKQLNGWYCVGFVLTDQMLKNPLPAASKK
jgi:hypothetical protein